MMELAIAAFAGRDQDLARKVLRHKRINSHITNIAYPILEEKEAT